MLLKFKSLIVTKIEMNKIDREMNNGRSKIPKIIHVSVMFGHFRPSPVPRILRTVRGIPVGIRHLLRIELWSKRLIHVFDKLNAL